MKPAEPLDVDPHTAALPQVPRGYTALRLLERGGTAEVVLARRDRDGAEVALKWLAPDRLAPRTHGAWAERFEREIRLLTQIEDERVVRVLDHGREGERRWVALEYVSGGSLRERLAAGRPLPLADVRGWIAQIAAGLGTLHRRGILHRDLKPDNVLLTAAGEVRIVDFGLATHELEVGDLTTSGEVLGTADYLAPEQKYRLSVDARADQYALAVIAYELLTARKPLGSFPPPSRRNPEIGAQLDAVLLRALSEDAEDRFADVGEFAAAFDAACAGGTAALRRRRLVFPVFGLLAIGLAFALLRRTPGKAAEAVGTPVAAVPGGEGGAPPGGLGRPSGMSEASWREYERQMQLALAFGAQARWQESLDACDAALLAWPDSVEAHFDRGCALAGLERHEEALAAYGEALIRDPQHLPSLTNRAFVRSSGGDEEGAMQDFDAAVAAAPDEPRARFNRLELAKRRGEYEKAVGDLERLVELLPDDLQVREDLAWFLATVSDEQLADPERAAALARELCTGGDWQAWRPIVVLAVAEARCGRREQSLEYAQRALEATPLERRERIRSQLSIFISDL